jgi:hypothetical protein
MEMECIIENGKNKHKMNKYRYEYFIFSKTINEKKCVQF